MPYDWADFFNQNELVKLVISNFYLILYYNSEIWHIPTLKATIKIKLLSASAFSKAFRVCTSYIDFGQSFQNLQQMCKRATPEKIMKYKMALCLIKLYNQKPRNENSRTYIRNSENQMRHYKHYIKPTENNQQ